MVSQKKSAESLVICQTFSNFAPNSINQPTIMIDLKQNLKDKGWTSIALGHALGTTQPAASKLINGNPTLSNLQKIAEIVGCSVSELVRDNEEDSHKNNLLCPHCGKPISIETKISAQ